MAVNTTDTVTPKRAKKPEVTEAQMVQDVHSTSRELAAQPKRMVRLPRPEGLEKAPDEVVHINGHVFTIQRGVDVEVPQSVYEILDEAGRLG